MQLRARDGWRADGRRKRRPYVWLGSLQRSAQRVPHEVCTTVREVTLTSLRLQQKRRWQRAADGGRRLLDADVHRAVLVVLTLTIGVSACGSAGGEPYRAVRGGSPARGAAALKTYGCGACHVIPGIGGADGMVGPPLTAFGRRTIIAGELTNTEDNLIRWIEHPQAVLPGNVMPDLGVTAQDARDMAAYLYTLK